MGSGPTTARCATAPRTRDFAKMTDGFRFRRRSLARPLTRCPRALSSGNVASPEMTAQGRGWRGGVRFASALAAVLVALVGCASSQPKDPTPCTDPEQLPVLIDSDLNFNPGPNGQPLPTVVRVYQLKGTNLLSVVSLDEIMRNEKAALADDLLEVQEITLKPKTRHYPELLRKPGATHVAVAAFYRQPTAESWRAMAPLPPVDPFACHKKNEAKPWIQFFLHGYKVDHVLRDRRISP
ncbi:MAG TPA: type VI secretion system lipoprotein TssJ [Polyangia bacterium]